MLGREAQLSPSPPPSQACAMWIQQASVTHFTTQAQAHRVSHPLLYVGNLAALTNLCLQCPKLVYPDFLCNLFLIKLIEAFYILNFRHEMVNLRSLFVS